MAILLVLEGNQIKKKKQAFRICAFWLDRKWISDTFINEINKHLITMKDKIQKKKKKHNKRKKKTQKNETVWNLKQKTHFSLHLLIVFVKSWSLVSYFTSSFMSVWSLRSLICSFSVSVLRQFSKSGSKSRLRWVSEMLKSSSDGRRKSRTEVDLCWSAGSLCPVLIEKWQMRQ